MDEGTYEDHRRRADLAYLLEYTEWVESLGEADRRKLEETASANHVRSRDIREPDLDETSRTATGASGDAAESAAAAEWPVMRLDTLSDLLREELGLTEWQAGGVVELLRTWSARLATYEKARVVTKVAGQFLCSSNAKLDAAGLAYAANLAITSGMGSIRQWARANGVSPFGVSKVAKRWHRELDLPPSPHLRDESLSRVYAGGQSNPEKGGHWRERKFKRGMLKIHEKSKHKTQEGGRRAASEEGGA